MVRVIDETTHYYETRCKNCNSYLIFETEDERCYHEKDRRVWRIRCPKCGMDTPTYEITETGVIDYQIKC